MKWLHSPLLHFLFIGAAIYLACGLFGPRAVEQSDDTVVVTASELEWLAQTFASTWNRAPTRQDLAGLVKAHIREQVLYREAMAMGLDRNDVIIRRRLAQKLEFLYQDLADMTPPSVSEIETYFLAHIEEYQEPELITFTQIFVNPDRHGDQTLADAAAIRDRLSALQDPLRDAADEGDSFMLQRYYPQRSQAEVAKLFGDDFATPLFELAAGKWHGPVRSGYGVHLVYVHDRLRVPPPEFAQVQARVLMDLQAERRRAFNEEQYAALRARYNVVIEGAIDDEDTKDAAQSVVKK